MAATPTTLINIVLSKYRLKLLDKRSLGTLETLGKLLELKDRPIEIRSAPVTLDTALYEGDDEPYEDEVMSTRRSRDAQIDLDAESHDKKDIFNFGKAVASLKQDSSTPPLTDVRSLEEFQRINKDILGALWTQQYSFTLREKGHPGDALIFHCNSVLIYKQLDYGNLAPQAVDPALLDAENKLKMIDWLTQMTQDRLLVDKIELVARTIRIHRDVQPMLASFNQDSSYAVLLKFIGSNVEAFLDTLNKLPEGISQGLCLNDLNTWHSKYCN